MAANDRSRIPLLYMTAALDPTLVSGIYNYCDQWCRYCAATTRCLAFRCNLPRDRALESDTAEEVSRRMAESLNIVRALNAAEGRLLPDLEAILSNDLDAQRRYMTTDPLHKMAMQYSAAANTYLGSRPDFPLTLRSRPNGPTPFEVFAWYHMLVGVKVHRAIMGLEAVARGEEGFSTKDAMLQARTALVAIERSQVALRALLRRKVDRQLEAVAARLQPLPEALLSRFPDLRSISRPGLDEPAPVLAAGSTP